MDDIKFTHKLECPVCETNNLELFEYLGPVIDEDNSITPNSHEVAELQWQYRCHSEICKGQTIFRAAWHKVKFTIIQELSYVKKIKEKNECPFCNKQLESCKSTSKTGSQEFVDYVCNNTNCDFKFLKIPKSLWKSS